MKLISLMIIIFTIVLGIVVILGVGNQFNNDCISDDKSFVVSGIVTDVEYLGDCNMINFVDGRVLYLHGSPNEKYHLEDLDNLLIVGFNYTFYYHHECVMSDGNEVWYHQGNVIDKIMVYR